MLDSIYIPRDLLNIVVSYCAIVDLEMAIAI